MRTGTRLSFANVSWPQRFIAVAIEIVAAAALIGPVVIYYQSLSNDSSISELLLGGTFTGLFFTIWLFPILLVIVVVGWGLPILALTWLALWLRLNIFAFVALGALSGLLGPAFANLPGGSMYGLKHLLNAGSPDGKMIVQAICGALSAALGWSYMCLMRKRPVPV